MPPSADGRRSVDPRGTCQARSGDSGLDDDGMARALCPARSALYPPVGEEPSVSSRSAKAMNDELRGSSCAGLPSFVLCPSLSIWLPA
ncbi:Fn3_like domain-containing protein [Psidium guajava]|nr:Fn3_like domain-containing protein [Psidium guajava]